MVYPVKLIMKVAVMTAVLAVPIYQGVFRVPAARAAVPRLARELEQIFPPEQAHFVQEHKSYNIMASTGKSYSSALPWEALRDHYDQELMGLGWTVLETRPLRSWGRDFGGATRVYQKGDLRASLEYIGKGANFGWDYAIEISWEKR
jgi:hypothetical protein